MTEKTENLRENKATSIDSSGERVDNIGFGNLKIIQMPKDFCYGIDAVILSDFAAKIAIGKGPKQKCNVKKVIDLGTGTGIIPLILSHKTEISRIYGIEIQKASMDRARRSVELNCLNGRIEILCGDVSKVLRNNEENLEGTFDMVVSNPPYVAMGSGIRNANGPKYVARQETTATLDDFVKTGALLLKDKGHFVMVHRPSRLGELIFSMKTHGIEPKTLRFVSPLENEPPNILLIHGIKCGGRELEVMAPLIVYETRAKYSKELRNIYER